MNGDGKAIEVLANDPARPRCRFCAHHYVTHDPNFPYGCRQLGFKSGREPMRDVIESSGEICLYFSDKRR